MQNHKALQFASSVHVAHCTWPLEILAVRIKSSGMDVKTLQKCNYTYNLMLQWSAPGSSEAAEQ
eukprot:6318803-Amphidinium_carterae.1